MVVAVVSTTSCFDASSGETYPEAYMGWRCCRAGLARTPGRAAPAVTLLAALL
jgi:hypothetical protein